MTTELPSPAAGSEPEAVSGPPPVVTIAESASTAPPPTPADKPKRNGKRQPTEVERRNLALAHAAMAARRMIRQGESDAEIVATLGVDIDRVVRWRARFGVPATVNGHDAEAALETTAVDTRSPVAAATSYQGVGGVAPGLLPPDTNLYPWPIFIVLAPLKSRYVKVMMTLSVIAALAVWLFLLPQLPAVWQVAGAFTVAILLYVVNLAVIIKRTTSPAVVFRRMVGSGLIIMDEQAWWVGAAAYWPEAWRRQDERGRRPLWIDAIDYAPHTVQGDDPVGVKERLAAHARRTVYGFDPWLAPAPGRPANMDKSIPYQPPSQAQLGIAWARARATRGILDARDHMGELIKQGGLMLLIGVGWLLIYLGGVRMAESLTASDVAGLEATLREQIKADVIRELVPQPTARPVQPFGQ